ncbi:MAG: hypothetical protein LUQ69_10260, partial [Methanoregulaceae archaeon]|nr:hypothetical protein [Methanoregulaceae archaeon]
MDLHLLKVREPRLGGKADLPGEDDRQSSSIKKLEMVIKKGDTIISMLEKQGIETDQIKKKMIDARESFSRGDAVKAYKLAQSGIVELMALKDKVEQERLEDRSQSKKGKGVFALIRDNNVEILKKIDEWKLIVKGWRDKGYEFEKDESFFGKSFEEIERRFISIGEQIEKAEELRGRINRLREEHPNIGKSYRKKIQDIEGAAFKLDRLDDLDRKLKNLSSSLKPVDERSLNLRSRISRFKRNGLNTSYLEEILDNDEDMDYIEKQFNIYESNMEFLLKEKQKLKVFKEEPFIDGLEDKVTEIEGMLDNPWKLDDVVEKMLVLEKLIKVEKDNQRKRDDERKRRIEIKKTLDKYASEGYKVAMVEQLLDEDINLLEEEFDIFMRQSSRLRSLKEKLFKLDATGFEEEVSKLSEKLFDPSNIDKIEKELEALKENILNQRIRSQKIENAIKEWSGMGFNVTKLENALKRDMNHAEQIYEDYKDRIKELTDYDSRLSEMQHKETSDIVHKLSLMIKNPELIETVRKEMARVQKIVADLDGIKNKRKELNTLLKVWKSQGYKIDHILELMKMENTYQGLEDIILGYTRAIASLESFRPEMAVESRGWFPELESFIKENMFDPDLSQEVLTHFDELKNLNRKEEKRRGEISRKLKELSSRGINVSRMEP